MNPSQPHADRRTHADDGPFTDGQPREGADRRDDRRSVVDRRSGVDRRLLNAGEQPLTGLERRRGPGRRLSDSQRAAEEGDPTPEQFLFVAAIDSFKKANQVNFPAWTDVLEVIRLLGYRKTRASELNLRNAEDWTEPADGPANVRPKGWERRFAA